MSIVINLTDEQREDLLVTALEGGSNYWYHLSDDALNLILKTTKGSKEALSVRVWEAIKTGIAIPVHDAENEDEQLGEISLETIAKGEQLLADKHLQHLCDILTDGGWDANTADVWFQYCSLGKLVYG
jgi:hypothetical protein